MSTRPLIKYSLVYLNMCGLDPTCQNWRTRWTSRIMMISLMYLLIEFGLNFSLHWKGWDSLDAFAPCFAFYQVLFKMAIMIMKKDKLQKLLRIMGKFWTLDNHHIQFQQEILSIYNAALTALKSYSLAAIITLSTYFLKPLFVTDRVLPFETYHPIDRSSNIMYVLAYVVQMFDIFIAWSSMFGFESLFFSIIVNLICELKILKHRFSILKIDLTIDEDTDTTLEKVHELIDHHNLILRCIKDVDRIYYTALLNQFFSSLICLTAGLLGTIVNGLDMDHLANFIFYMASILGQLFIYCIGGAFLSLEAESVSEAVYQSDWWVKPQPKLRRAYVLILQRAQKSEKLTAGGMFNVDLISYKSIVQASFSFFTLVRAVYTKYE